MLLETICESVKVLPTIRRRAFPLQQTGTGTFPVSPSTGDEALHPAVESPSAATKGTTMETVPSASYSQVTLAPQQPHRQVTLDMSVPLAPTTDQQHASDPKPLQLRPEDRQEQQPANTIDPAQIPVEETTKFL